jgi:hypothetical protein
MTKAMLLIAVGLFLALLLFRFVRAILTGRRISREQSCRPSDGGDAELARLLDEARSGGGRAREVLRKLERNAHSGGAKDRAAFHCAAGNLAATELKRPNLAVGFYLRALREDPDCAPAFERIKEILISQKRVKRLENTCWEILGRLDDDAVGSQMWVRCWSALASVYVSAPRLALRADAIRKMLDAVMSEPSMDDSSDSDPCEDARDVPKIVPL